MDILLTVSYLGSAFAGWQRQANAVAVQQRLEEALERLLGDTVRVVGAGRTDAGVHADAQMVSFAVAREFPLAGLVHGTNHFLPPTVRVLAARAVPAGFDARREAIAKTYRYRLWPGEPAPVDRAPYVLEVPAELSRQRLEDATRAIVGRHDFAAFALAGAATRTTERRIFAAAWEEHDAELVLRVTGEGFLRGMVRSLVGTLLEVATGRRELDSFADLLAGGTRGDAGPTALPHGLALERVDYDPAVVPPGAPRPLW
jgi:tRNA pseudouridine38-40 synthase